MHGDDFTLLGLAGLIVDAIAAIGELLECLGWQHKGAETRASEEGLARPGRLVVLGDADATRARFVPNGAQPSESAKAPWSASESDGASVIAAACADAYSVVMIGAGMSVPGAPPSSRRTATPRVAACVRVEQIRVEQKCRMECNEHIVEMHQIHGGNASSQGYLHAHRRLANYYIVEMHQWKVIR